MYRMYVWTNGGLNLYVSEHATANDARFWMYAWIERGFIPIADSDPNTEYVMPAATREIQVVYFQFEAGAAPTQTVSLDSLVGLDIGP